MRGVSAFIIVLGLVLPNPAEAQDFLAALEAERTALQAEKAALEGALEEAESAGRSAEEALEAEIERLTASLARARAENAARAPQLPQGERVRSLENEARRVEQLKGRARAWLETQGATVAEGTDIDVIVGAALELVDQQGELRIERGEYFGRDGRAEQASLLHIGSVGALAAGDPPQPLVLAAYGSLRSVPGLDIEPPEVTGAGVAVDAVLFDPDDALGAPGYAEEGFWAWLEHGGPVMWPLVLLGLAAAILAIERTLALGFAALRILSLDRDRLVQGIESGLGGALSLSRTQPDLLAPIVLLVTLDEPFTGLEERVTDALRRSRDKLRRGLFFLGVVAAVSPLIGLLGTVTGMISTFGVITEHGTGDPRLLSAGISEALLTTQLGLTVAVPALLANALLARGAQRALARLEALAVELLAARRKASTHAA